MSQVWVEVQDAERGSVPTRCARTGERCITRTALTTAEVPALVEWSTWTGLWPRRRTREARRVVVSLLPWVQRTVRGLELTRDVTAVAIPLLLVVGLLLDGIPGQVVRLLALACLAVKAVVAAVGATWVPRAQLDQTGEWILLDHVHDDAVATIRARTSRPEVTPTLPGADTTPAAALARPRTTDTG